MTKREKDHDRDEDVRLDKWLWAARFFKTRSLAHEAIEGGKVYIDGVRAKPSRIVARGQEIRINTYRGEFVIVVEGISAQRGPGAVAATLYRETEDSKQRREELAVMHKLSLTTAPSERPNTQDRRALRRLKEG